MWCTNSPRRCTLIYPSDLMLTIWERTVSYQSKSMCETSNSEWREEPLPSFEKYFLFLNINSVQFHPIDVIYLLWNYSHLLNADIYIYSTMVMVFLHYASLLAWKLLTLLFFSFVFWHLKSWLHCRLFSIVNLRMFSIWHQTNNKQHLISQVILQSFSNSS